MIKKAILFLAIVSIVLISGCDSHKRNDCDDSLYFIQRDMVVTYPEQCQEKCLEKYKSDNFLIEEDKTRPGHYSCFCDIYNCTRQNQTVISTTNIINERKTACMTYVVYDPKCDSDQYLSAKENLSTVCKRYSDLINKSYPCNTPNIGCVKECCYDYCFGGSQNKNCLGFEYLLYQEHSLNKTNFELDLLSSNLQTNITAITIEKTTQNIKNTSVSPGDLISIIVEYETPLTAGTYYNYTVSVFYDEGNHTRNETAVCSGKVE